MIRFIACFSAGIFAPVVFVFVVNGFAFGTWFHGTVPDWTLSYAIPLGLLGGIVGGIAGAGR